METAIKGHVGIPRRIRSFLANQRQVVYTSILLSYVLGPPTQLQVLATNSEAGVCSWTPEVSVVILGFLGFRVWGWCDMFPSDSSVVLIRRR